MKSAPKPPGKLIIYKRQGIQPEFKQRILELCVHFSYRDVADKIMKMGHPEISASTIRRWVLSVKNGPQSERLDTDVQNRIEPVSEFAPADRTPSFDTAMGSVEQNLQKLGTLFNEAAFLATDSDFLLFETGPLEKLADGVVGRRLLLDKEGKPIPLTDAKIGALSRVIATRLKAIEVARSCVQGAGEISLMQARLEVMVKAKITETAQEITKEEREKVLQIATPEERDAILDGSQGEKVFHAVLARVRAQA